MKVKNLIPAVLLALALSATFVLADYHFVGEGWGACGNIYPWGTWDGWLDTDETNHPFEGDWWCVNHYGDINGDSYYNAQTGVYSVSQGNWDCKTDMELDGHWSGYFAPTASPDTAGGSWWEIDYYCQGTWAGHLAE